jgi:hypothetical protein
VTSARWRLSLALCRGNGRSEWSPALRLPMQMGGRFSLGCLIRRRSEVISVLFFVGLGARVAVQYGLVSDAHC